jgi:2-polyprenyl-3-methyl-5-hydroxy-6-metoxy-1,4-benzoquinol methylase
MFSWLDFYKEKLSKYTQHKNDPTALLEKLKQLDNVMYNKVINAGGKEILTEKFFHKFELSTGCFIPGLFDMRQHLKEMNFPELKDKYVLDVGCSDGGVTQVIAAMGNNVIAMDAHGPLIKHVNFISDLFGTRDRITAIECDFHAYKVPEEKKFDVIVVMHVLCHHPSEGILSFLNKADECLANDGVLLVCDNTKNVQKLIMNRYDVKVLGKSNLPTLSSASVLYECRKK